MPDIRHRVEITVPPAVVYGAVATTDGLSAWWTRDGVRGESVVGGKIEFYFGSPEPSAVVEVTKLSPGEHVWWNCVGGAADWVGTELRFDLAPNDAGTVVLFSHSGWRSPSEFMAHCSARWAYFLLSLKALVETGTGTPSPDDLRF